MRSFTVMLVVLGLAAPALRAQAPAPTALLAAGDSLSRVLRPDLALERYQAALAATPGWYLALWRAGRAAVDVAKQIDAGDPPASARRDSLYLLARAYAERAIAADSTGADGHFVLALALGRLARTRSGRERVRFGRIIYDQAALALRLRPDHDGAHHVLGAWHAEVMRLSGPTRLVARLLFGGSFLARASWDSATAHLRRAVELNPPYIYHRLELAEVYLDLRRWAEAAVQLEAIATLPVADVLDPRHRRRAAVLLEKLKGKRPGAGG